MNLFFISSVIAFVAMVYLAILVALKGKSRGARISLSLFLLSLSFGIFGDFITFLSRTHDWLPLLRWQQIAHLGMVFAPAFALSFVFALCRKKLPILVHALFYGVSIALVVANVVTDLFISGVSIAPSGVAELSIGPAYHVFLGMIVVVLALSCMVLYRSFSTSEDPHLKTQIKYYLMGSAFVVGSVAFYVPAMLGKDVPRIDNLFLCIFAAFLAYAITKHELLDVDVVASRILSHLIVIFLVILSFALSFPAVEKMPQLTQLFVWVSISIFWGYTSKKLQLMIQTPLDRRLLKGSYDPQKVIRDMAAALVTIQDTQSTLQTISQKLIEDVEVSQNYVFIRQGAEPNFHFYTMQYNQKPLRQDASLATSAQTWFEANPVVILYRDLPQEIKSDLVKLPLRLDKTLWIPVHSMGRLQVVLIVGQKSSGEWFKFHDINFFSALMSQCTVIFDRIFQHEELEIKNEALTDLNQNLEKRVIEEVERATKAMEIAEKNQELASYATLTRGIAHEIRNPLNIMMNNMDALKFKLHSFDLPPDDKELCTGLVSNFVTGTRRLTDILDTMLTFGRDDGFDLKEISVNKIIEETVQLAGGQEVHLDTDLDESIPMIHSNATILHQIVINLVLNAMEAVKMAKRERGTVTVGSSLVDFKPQEDSDQTVKGIKITVKDNGIGMSDEKRKKIFDPFYTSKYEHAGLGLAFVWRFVDKHNGRIDVLSTEGEGTTFEVCIPLVHTGELATQAPTPEHTTEPTAAADAPSDDPADW